MPAMMVRARIAVAAVVLALPAATGLWELFRYRSWALFSPLDEVIALWVVVGTCCGAGVALATGRWWGRFIPLAIAGMLILGALASGAFGLRYPSLYLGLVLLLSLSGRAMFDRFEARAPLPLDWTAPGMNVVRWALVGNAAGLMHSAGRVLYLATSVRGSPVYEAPPLFHTNCFPPAKLFIELGDFLIPAGTVLLLMGGLILLARQRTIGLFVTAGAALAQTVLVVNQYYASSRYVDPVRELVPVLPGLLLTWVALIVWSRPILRFLRGQ